MMNFGSTKVVLEYFVDIYATFRVKRQQLRSLFHNVGDRADKTNSQPNIATGFILLANIHVILV